MVIVVIEIEPTEGEYVFENAIVGGAIPKEYIPAIDAGIKEACNKWYNCRISMLLILKLS